MAGFWIPQVLCVIGYSVPRFFLSSTGLGTPLYGSLCLACFQTTWRLGYLGCGSQKCSTSPPAVTRLTVYHRLQVCPDNARTGEVWPQGQITPRSAGSEMTGVKRQIFPSVVLATGESPRRLSCTVGSAYARSSRESEFRQDLTVGSREKAEKPPPNTRNVRGCVF